MESDLIGYLDEDGCLIPIQNFEPRGALHSMEIDPAWREIRQKDLDDPSFGWEVTV